MRWSMPIEMLVGKRYFEELTTTNFPIGEGGGDF